MFDSVRPHSRQPTKLPRPWDSPGKNTGVGCHFLLQCMKVKSESEVAQSCPTLLNPMDSSLPGSSVHGIFQARVLEWAAITFSGGRVRGKRGTLSAPERGVDFPPEEEELVVSGEQGVPYVRTSLVPRAQRSGLFLRPTKSA